MLLDLIEMFLFNFMMFFFIIAVNVSTAWMYMCT